MAGLTVWCVRFLQASWVQPERIGKSAVPAPVRVVEDMGLDALARVLAGRALVYLPDATGAGPCGTLARRAWTPRMIDPEKLLGQRQLNAVPMPPMRSLSPMAWSVQHLVPQLQHYYATRPVPKKPKLGAKHGGGNGRAAYV